MNYKKKLIEVALPLAVINEACRKQGNPFLKGHPRAMHLWWARRPLAACRAVLFSSLVDDPSEHPDKFPTEELQGKERQRLFKIIEDLVLWENSNNEVVLRIVRDEIKKATGNNPPPVLDPFCGGGSIPLEAQRLGLEAHGSDLNPVAVMITKAMIEIPPKFSHKPPIHPLDKTGQQSYIKKDWKGAAGLAEDIRYYAEWMRKEADKRIGHLYPKLKLPVEYGGHEATVIAWLWTRTIKCPNPACGAKMPLVRSFYLSTKKGKEVYVVPVVDNKAKEISFVVKTGDGKCAEGTVNRAGAKCIVCNTPVPLDYIRSEGKAGRMSAQLMAMVVEGHPGKRYIAPDQCHIDTAIKAKSSWKPEELICGDTRDFRTALYGMSKFGDVFTPRQLVSLNTFCDLVGEARKQILADAKLAGMNEDGKGINNNGNGANAYADAITTYLAFAINHLVRYSSSLSPWNTTNQNIVQAFGRQAMPMIWDFAEANIIGGTLNISLTAEWIAAALEKIVTEPHSFVKQLDATEAINRIVKPLISTDPPYYDNISYADLSDFFYVWLRKNLSKIYPDIFSTVLVPKARELVATPFRFGGNKEKAGEFFEEGLSKAFERMKESTNSDYPLTVYYAFKQSEADEPENEDVDVAIASTGWETMLEGLVKSNFQIVGTWPLHTEKTDALKKTVNALASSIIIVCRPRSQKAQITSRKDFISELKKELPVALKNLQHGNIAPVDLAQASIGPGMAIFSKYAKVIEADGSAMRIRTALALINQTLDEVLSEQEGDLEPDTRWAIVWFRQNGMEEGLFGDAETLSKAKNVAVQGLIEAGILVSKGNKVRLLKRDELDPEWDPTTDKRLTVWEVVQHLILKLDKEGIDGAAKLLGRLGASIAESARALSYQLYSICERKKWTQDALGYNSLITAWPDMEKRSRELNQANKEEDNGPKQFGLGV